MQEAQRRKNELKSCLYYLWQHRSKFWFNRTLSAVRMLAGR